MNLAYANLGVVLTAFQLIEVWPEIKIPSVTAPDYLGFLSFTWFHLFSVPPHSVFTKFDRLFFFTDFQVLTPANTYYKRQIADGLYRFLGTTRRNSSIQHTPIRLNRLGP